MDRFINKLERLEDGCLIFTGSTVRGYGRFWDGERLVLAHRFSFELTHGPIPPGHDVHHTCRNRLCVEPLHLQAVPTEIHALQGFPEGYENYNSQKTHCPKGHPYDEENTYVSKKGQRMCRACGREKAALKRGPKPPHYLTLRTHCPQGHEYTPENTRIVNGARYCRECGREAARRYYHEKGKGRRNGEGRKIGSGDRSEPVEAVTTVTQNEEGNP